MIPYFDKSGIRRPREKYMPKNYTFQKLDLSVEEFRHLVKQARQDSFQIAALTAVALCNFRFDRNRCIAMLNGLKNPADPMTDREINSITERLSGKDFIPYSYFTGAIQFNDYTPRQPYTIIVKDNKYSFYNDGFAELWLHSTGSNEDRPVRLRQKASSGSWYLSEQMLIVDMDLAPAEDEEIEDDDPWG